MRLLLGVVWILSLLGCSTTPHKRQPRAALRDFGLAVGQARERSGQNSAPPRGARAPVGAPAPPVTEREIARQFQGRPAPGQPVLLALVELRDHANTQVARPVVGAQLDAFRERLSRGQGRATPNAGGAPGLGLAAPAADGLLRRALGMRALRYCAARARADLLLLLTRASERYDYNNAWSHLYPTLVGWLLAPGNTLEIHTQLEAALLDVRTGRVLGVVVLERSSSRRLLPLARNRAGMRALAAEQASELFGELADKTLEMTKQIK